MNIRKAEGLSFIHNQGGTARIALVPVLGMRAFLYSFLTIHIKEEA
jgi:hypothetical protein